jgi:hypothetical protein
MPSFAEFALARLPGLSRKLRGADFTRWLAGHERLEVESAPRWLVWGDRLADEAEMQLEWARGEGLVDPARLHALEAEYRRDDPDVETIELP